MGIVEEGLTPYVYTQGDYTSRLEVLKDVPKGKAIYHVEKDIFKAKEVLSNITCLTGGPPNSLLCTGTAGQVRDCCKKLIDVVGKGGGLILNPAATLIDETPENVKAMTDFTRKYGAYR